MITCNMKITSWNDYKENAKNILDKYTTDSMLLPAYWFANDTITVLDELDNIIEDNDSETIKTDGIIQTTNDNGNMIIPFNDHNVNSITKIILDSNNRLKLPDDYMITISRLNYIMSFIGDNVIVRADDLIKILTICEHEDTYTDELLSDEKIQTSLNIILHDISYDDVSMIMRSYDTVCKIMKTDDITQDYKNSLISLISNISSISSEPDDKTSKDDDKHENIGHGITFSEDYYSNVILNAIHCFLDYHAASDEDSSHNNMKKTCEHALITIRRMFNYIDNVNAIDLKQDDDYRINDDMFINMIDCSDDYGKAGLMYAYLVMDSDYYSDYYTISHDSVSDRMQNTISSNDLYIVISCLHDGYPLEYILELLLSRYTAGSLCKNVTDA